IRGAARQHGGRKWGIDLSTWRYWTNGPTEYDAAGHLVSGWSASTVKRHLYASYLAGADLIQNEAATYETPAGLNPLGQTVRDFADFALNRHRDRGTPYVPMAIMQSHTSGCEPKFGEYARRAQKWYLQAPYTDADRMLS